MAKTKVIRALIYADPIPAKLERLLRIVADVETVTERGNAMSVLGSSFHFYFIEKGIPNGSTFSDMLVAQNDRERPLIYLITDDTVVTEDDLAKYNALCSIPSSPSRADFGRIGILIPNRLKRAHVSMDEPRELNGELLQFQLRADADINEEQQGSLMALEEPEEAAEDEPHEEPEPDQELIPEDLDDEEEEAQSADLIPPAARRSAAAFFANVRSRFARDTASTAGEGQASPSSTGARWRAPAIVGVILAFIIGIGVFAMVANRPASSSKKTSSKTTTTRTPEGKDETTLPGAQTSTPATTQPAVTANDTETPRESTPATSPEPSLTPAPQGAPAPEPVNNRPSVSISGPSYLMRGESATYTASASDPDGDSVSLSWTSRAFCSDVPGTYSLSVTATDSRGASSNYSISISVI